MCKTILKFLFRQNIFKERFKEELKEVFKKNIIDIDNNLQKMTSDDDKIIYLETLIKMMKRYFIYEMMTKKIFYEPTPYADRSIFLPIKYKNINGDTVYLSIDEGNRKTVDLQKDFVFTTHWNPVRLINSVKRKEKFKYYEMNHFGYYYKGIDITCVDNGTHSVTDGILNRDNASIEVKIYCCDEILESIYTDGVNWYNKFDDTIIEEIFSYKFAFLFTLIQKHKEL